MDILLYVVFAIILAVVILALLKICDAYGDIGSPDTPASVEVDAETAGGANHVNHEDVRGRRTSLSADVVVDVLRFSSPDTIESCCLSSRQLNSIVTSLKNARPLRSIDFVRIGEHSKWSSQVKEECCHVEETELNLTHFSSFVDAIGWATVCRAVMALSPSRVHCAFNDFERAYRCLTTRGFVTAKHVVVEGNMRTSERLLWYVTKGRRGSLCWLSNEQIPADGCNFMEAIIETFEAQTEVGSFEHPLFLQFPYRPIGWHSEASCLEKNVGLAPIEGFFDIPNMARFYPGPKKTFDKHVVRCSDTYKIFVLDNAGGQRIFVVASDDDASMMDGNYWLQRVAFVRDLSILRE